MELADRSDDEGRKAKAEAFKAQAEAMAAANPRASSLEAMLARISAETCKAAQERKAKE